MADSEHTHDEVFTPQEWREVLSQLALSPRQAGIVRLLFHGYCDKQIARRLGVKETTLRTHMGRLCEKLETTGRVEIILAVFKQFRSGCDMDACPRLRAGERQAQVAEQKSPDYGEGHVVGIDELSLAGNDV